MIFHEISLRGATSDLEDTALVEQLSVRANFSLAHVADHVPVQTGMVVAAGLGVAGAQRHVKRAAQLLVKEDGLGKALDAKVSANGELAHIARAGVAVERAQQKRLILAGAGLHHAALLEL